MGKGPLCFRVPARVGSCLSGKHQKTAEILLFSVLLLSHVNLGLFLEAESDLISMDDISVSLIPWEYRLEEGHLVMLPLEDTAHMRSSKGGVFLKIYLFF